MASDQCLRCGLTMDAMGVQEFRVGGTSGGWKLMFGEWAELGEGMMPLSMFVCTSCGYTEFRHPNATT